jgi:hypothetical protein
MVFKPFRPLERHLRARTCLGSQGWSDERTKSTSNIGRSNVVNWTGSVSHGLLVAPHNAFDAAGEFEVHTGVECGIAAMLLVLDVPFAISGTYVVPSMVIVSSMPCAAARAAAPRSRKVRISLLFLFV